jgi:DNA-binding NarL/FixJ family response regulator
MPLLNGIEATRQITKHAPASACSSEHASRRSVRDADPAGGRGGYLLKDSADVDLLQAVRRFPKGIVLQSRHRAPDARRLRQAASGEPGVVDRYESLSDREREVFQLIAEGKTNKDIAAILFISPSTVETHRARIMEKLDVHSAAEIVLYAVRRGVIR